MTQAELESLKYMVIRDKIGMGPLEPLISDEWIEDISCSGIGPVYIEHKIFKGLKSSISFDTHEELDDFVLKLAEKMKKPVTFRNPIVDATLPDGSRINIVYGGDVSKNGSNFTIRKFMGMPLSIIDICDWRHADVPDGRLSLADRRGGDELLRLRRDGFGQDDADERADDVHRADGEDRQHRGHAGSAGAAPELDARGRPRADEPGAAAPSTCSAC